MVESRAADRVAGAADDDEGGTSGARTGATALGAAPLPFLAIYAVLFLVHGSIRPVQPPDITGSTRGELVAGLIAVLVLAVFVLALAWLYDGRRRWPFALTQASALGACIAFLLDPGSGSPAVPVLLVVTCTLALGLAFLPARWRPGA